MPKNIKGIIIRKEWLELILSGKKTWEMRSSKTKHRGLVFLIEAGTGQVKGYCFIQDCIDINVIKISCSFKFQKHQVTDYSLLQKWHYAWVIDKVKSLPKPINYTHKKGCVVWVDLSDNIELKQQMTLLNIS